MDIKRGINEAMKLLGSEGSKKERNGENMPQLEITEVLLLYFHFVNNQYQRSSRLLCSFVPNKSIGQMKLQRKLQKLIQRLLVKIHASPLQK